MGGEQGGQPERVSGESLRRESAVLRAKQRQLQFMAVLYVQQMAKGWLVRHRQAKEAAWAPVTPTRRDATGLTQAQSAALRKVRVRVSPNPHAHPHPRPHPRPHPTLTLTLTLTRC